MAVVFIVTVLAACREHAPGLAKLAHPPALAPLEILTVLEPTAHFVPSGVAGTSDCSILVAGREWGTLARIHPAGRADSSIIQIPGYRDFPSLEAGPDGAVVVWAAEPAYLAVVQPNLTLDSIEIPMHPWGGRWMGPAVPLSGERYAVAPISNRQKWVADPDPWIDAPLVQILDEHGNVRATAGSLERRDGRYLTWLANRAVLGSHGDTIVALRLSSGELTRYVPSEVTGFETVKAVRLTPYFEAPAPTEEVHRQPWTTEGGEVFLHVHIAHVETAAFGRERLYAIRNYDAEWVRRESEKSFDTEGRWEVTSRGLEVYDLGGSRLAAFAVPVEGVSWMRADINGRLFLGSSGSVIVAHDATMGYPICPPMPGRIELPFRDDPPLPSRNLGSVGESSGRES